VKFNKKGFIKIKSERYGDVIILTKYDWVARQAIQKKHIAYTIKELEEFLTMERGEQDIWHNAKKLFGGNYVGTYQEVGGAQK
tara:strand:- start:951 stop:1199 length:249 start_codon:yes stop_codon:yes gene_type:complete